MFLGAYVEKQTGPQDARVGRRVPRPRRHPPARHLRHARRAPGRGLPDPPGVRLLDLGDGVRRRRRRRRRRASTCSRPAGCWAGRERRRRARPRSWRPRPGCCTRSQMARPDIDFVAANEAATCRYMKMITLPKLRDALREMSPVVKVPDGDRRARAAADRADGRDRLSDFDGDDAGAAVALPRARRWQDVALLDRVEAGEARRRDVVVAEVERLLVARDRGGRVVAEVLLSSPSSASTNPSSTWPRRRRPSRRRRLVVAGAVDVAVSFAAVELADRDRLAVERGDDAGVLGPVLDAVVVAVGLERVVARTVTSSPSLSPSWSVSALRGLVPSLNSREVLERRRLSASLAFQAPLELVLRGPGGGLGLLRRGRGRGHEQRSEQRGR